MEGLIWNWVLTIVAGLGTVVWKLMNDRVHELEKSKERLVEELNSVKIKYVEKDELDRIEARIDQRFFEMREYMKELLNRSR